MKRSKEIDLRTCFVAPKGGYRSVNVKLDYGTPEIVASYLPTYKSLAVLEALFAGTALESRDRASAIVAPYGSGKSSLLLFLCSLLENAKAVKRSMSKVQEQIQRLSPNLGKSIAKSLAEKNGFIVVMLSGDEGSLEVAFRLALKEALERRDLEKVWQEIASPPQGEAGNSGIEDHSTIDLFKKAARAISPLGYKGIFVAYDEFGKVLEGQQINPRPGDLFFLQSFAELCSRSGKYQIHLILALHQGFTQYAHRLPVYVRNEWAKIEGRFRIFNYVEDSLQVYELIAQALKKLHAPRLKSAATLIRKIVKPYVKTTKNVPAFSAFGSAKELQSLLESVYPLDPIALYILPRLSARVAQNERTLFHFLLGQEPNCLYPVLQTASGKDDHAIARVCDLFDYFSDLMQRDMGVGGVHRRYGEIVTALGRTEPDDTFAHSVIKTIGVLSIINEPLKLPPTLEVIQTAVGAFTHQTRLDLRKALDDLVNKKVLLYRRHNQEYRLWEGSDVDLIGLLRQKKAENETQLNTVLFLSSKLPPPYTLPHRYNENFGLVRYFEGSYISAQEIQQLNWKGTFGDFRSLDGRVYYVLADNQPEIDSAIDATRSVTHPQIIFAIPKFPLNLAEPVLELYCLEQLLSDSGFVSHDPVLQRELAELADDCLSAIQRKLLRLFEPHYEETIWIYKGERKENIKSQAGLNRLVSDVCADVFPSTPRFYSELINRRHPSATIVNARKKLLRAILENTGKENFGLSGFGPEISMFRAILRDNLYRSINESKWSFVRADQIEDPRLKNTIATIEDYLYESTDRPRSFGNLVNQLVSPPVGLRDGVLPILFAAVFQAFPLPLNLMVDGVFVKDIKAETFERMLLTPEKVTVQCVKLPDEMSQYLAAFPSIFSSTGGLPITAKSQKELLQLSLECVYRWVHQLPSCAMTTQQLSPEAIKLRSTLVKATDPVALILEELPQIYLEETAGLRENDPTPNFADKRQDLLGALKTSVEELNGFKSRLAGDVCKILWKNFRGNEAKDSQNLIEILRQWVGKLSGDIKDYLDDPQCSGFITRVMSNYETEESMAESLASLVTGRSISYWDDSFVRQFELGLLAIRKKINDTDELLKNREDRAPLSRDPYEWTLRLEHGGRPSGKIVISDLDPRKDLLAIKDRLQRTLGDQEKILTSEERRRVLLELLKEEL